MNWQKWVGLAACVVLMISCFMHWTWYPDIQKHFTGFDTGVFFKPKGKVINYYGRPGKLLLPLAAICFVLHLVPKIWAKWANLVIAALCAAYAVSRFFMFTNGYGNVSPQIEIGLWLMISAATVNLMAVIGARI